MTENVENRGELAPTPIDHNRKTRRFFDPLPLTLIDSISPEEIDRINTIGRLTDYDKSMTEAMLASVEINQYGATIKRSRSLGHLSKIKQAFSEHIKSNSFLTVPGADYVIDKYGDLQMFGATKSGDDFLQSMLGLTLPEELITTGGIHDEDEVYVIESGLYRVAKRINSVTTRINAFFSNSTNDEGKTKESSSIVLWGEALKQKYPPFEP